MKSFLIFFSLSVICILASCERVINVDVDNGPVQLSVDGHITDQPGPYTVILTKTQNYFNNNKFNGVGGAFITISDSQGTTDTLKEISPGIYNTKKIQGKVGNDYLLYINSTQFGEFTANTQIRRPFAFDTIYSKYEKDEFTLENIYNVRYTFTDKPGLGDALRIKVFVNDTLRNAPDELEFYNDENVDGNKVQDVTAISSNSKKKLKVNDKVRVELWSLTQDAYQFLTELRTQITNGRPFLRPTS